MWINFIVWYNIVQLVQSTHHQDLDQVFHQRTDTEWQQHWHHETYSKCRNNLVRHLFWACEKDIYKMERRGGGEYPTDSMEDLHGLDKRSKEMISIWKSRESALTILRSRRGRLSKYGNTITTECCNKRGCTWEEYAEYCPINKRRN